MRPFTTRDKLRLLRAGYSAHTIEHLDRTIRFLDRATYVGLATIVLACVFALALVH